MSSKKYQASCHCGSVKITITRQPEFMQDCNCTLCSNSGAVWGYLDPVAFIVAGDTKGYVRKDYPQPAVDIRFCNICGATTHWLLTEEYIARTGQNARMAVNMRLFKSEDLTGIELKFPDGINWIGEGECGFRRQSVILGDSYAL